ncbi:MAG: hypothetical protein C5B43_04110 [Verrucomicrobia bacterium]|nr:MAG: hypothetical protein C5B43_04110 [Verrucomicrobiota bacterium]
MQKFVSPNYPFNKYPVQKPILPIIDWKNPITSGLVFDALLADYPNTFTYDTISQTQGLIVPSGATWAGTPFGMGLDFSAAASSVNFSTDGRVNNLSQMSYECYFFERSTGGNGLGRIFQKNNRNGNGYFQVNFGTPNGFNIAAQYTTTDGVWGFASPATSGWYHLVVTYDDSSVNNIPNVYLNGVAQVVTASTVPVGTHTNDTANLFIGNRNDGIRNFDGQIAYLRTWNRILSQQEVSSLYSSPFQIYKQYQNSFLHTVGRINGNTTITHYNDSTKGPVNTGSGIIIDSITKNATSGTPNTLSTQHLVKSQDEILVALVECNTSGSLVVDWNGTKLTKNVDSANGNFHSAIFTLFNPSVGMGTLTVAGGVGLSNFAVTILSLLGVDKKTKNISTISATATSKTINQTITSLSPNSLILDLFCTNGVGGEPVSPQTKFVYGSSGLQYEGSFIFSQQESVNLKWNLTSSTAWAYSGIAFNPANNNSIWNPSVNLRNNRDVVNVNTLDVQENGAVNNNYYGYYPSTFYLNSFLHTIGRLIKPANVVIAQKVGETERPTSQIIIDKVFQGQVAAQALSTVTLNMDVNIPSQDADLIVTGGSVIATGAPWASVTLNGTPLTKLVQAGVANQSAEIWWSPRPGVGTNTLKILSGTGGEIYANAMVVLGLDNRSNNIITSSATDALSTSTINNTITPDAANCLIIDCLSTLNATAPPVPDQLQTQVFNATALANNEYVLSTYKIGQVRSQTMSWNLSVAANASLVSAAFRPAQAASMWFPNIDFRTLDDTVTTAGLDAEINPPFGNYGYKGSMFYQNSFLQTIGRMNRNFPAAIATAKGSTLLMMMVG